MKTKLKSLALGLLALSTLDSQLSTAHAQGTAFTYQGRLNDGATPASGKYDLRFIVYDNSAGGSQQGPLLTNSATAVSNGLFTVTLDFGNQFPGAARWLEIGVRTNGGGSFFTLSPRQALTPAPYAITAGNLTGLVPSAGVAGTYASPVTFSSLANSFSGNGSGLANVNALTLGGIGATGFWRTTGNAGTIAGPNFLGTTDNQPLELQVNGVRALRIEPTSAPSLVGGYFQNNANGFAAATIAGGGTSGSPNYILGNYGFVGAGHGARAGMFSAVVDGAYNDASSQFSFIGSGLANTNLADYSLIGSGSNNLIQTASIFATIGGGRNNLIRSNSVDVTISGGEQNSVGTNAGAATIGGGYGNTIADNAVSSTIAGGEANVVLGGATYSTVGGGFANSVNGSFATLGGGDANTGSGYAATVGGGAFDQATNVFATVPGGFGNVAGGQYSFAAGQQAQALHPGSFVWADTTSFTPFSSTANDQFLIRAGGGVGIGTGSPQSALHVKSPFIDCEVSIESGDAGGHRWTLQSSAPGAGGQVASSFQIIDRTVSVSRMLIDTSGNVGIGNTAPSQKLTVNGNILASGTVNGGSDRNVKEHFSSVSARDVLEKVSALPITEWNYKAENETLRHIGPMAQDFYAAFNVGMDDKHISMVDADGVALAAIQGLNQKLTEELKRRDAENAELKQRFDALEKIIRHQDPNETTHPSAL